jgi:SAM-dependent methyltransferase
VVTTVSYAAIWAELERQWSATFAPTVRERHTPAQTTELRRCDECGVEWFAGAAPGDPEFYRQLMAQVPYVAGRWEFEVVRGRLTGADRVVDFGSGDGEFLRSLAGVVSQRTGVDHNQDAVRRMIADGIDASAAHFSAFSAAHEGQFTVATAFQIVEHVEHVDDVIEPALRCLRPNGRLFISVPNRDRMPEAVLEPLDYPPHHLSRWGVDQLHAVAARLDFKVVRLDRQAPSLGRVAEQVMAPLDARLGARPLSPSRRIARGLMRHALIGPRRHDLVARMDGYARLGLYGHTMLVEMARA